jgi:hypothetical protein
MTRNKSNRQRQKYNAPPVEKVKSTPMPTVIGKDFSAEDTNRLKDLTLEQLADQYAQINKQYQMMKGLILLEARERFLSNNEFGDWVKSVHALCVDGQQVRNRYMNLAKFFKDRPMTGISLTVAYEISKPDNESIAEQIYNKAVNNNLSVEYVKELTIELKSDVQPRLKNSKSPTSSDTQLTQIFELVKGFNLTSDASIDLLNACILKFKDMSIDVIEGEVV